MKKLHLFLIILFLIFLVRLPYLFEPHWNFDESLYLTIGQALKRGAILYGDVYDLKPPFIYFTYFLLSSHLVSLRVFATVSVLLTSWWLFRLSKNLLAVLIFGFLTSLPTFEGGTANTEIFMLLPVTLAMVLVFENRSRPIFLLAGFLFGLAFFFKTVAIFDLLALNLFLLSVKKNFRDYFRWLTFQFLGFLVPTAFVFSYFIINHALADFINSVFLYNAPYINSQYLFLKICLLLITCFLLFIDRKKISNFNFLIYLWFTFSLFGALLAGRPYPHYLIQVLPSLSLLISQIRKTFWPATLAVLIFFFSFFFFNFYRYPLRSYYLNFSQYALGKKSSDNYLKFFIDPHLAQVYQAAAYLKSHSLAGDSLFVLADYPQLYELTNLQPASRFLAWRHLQLVPNAQKELVERLNRPPADFIAVFEQENFDFKKLESLMTIDYRQVASFDQLKIFQIRQFQGLPDHQDN